MMSPASPALLPSSGQTVQKHHNVFSVAFGTVVSVVNNEMIYLQLLIRTSLSFSMTEPEKPPSKRSFLLISATANQTQTN